MAREALVSPGVGERWGLFLYVQAFLLLRPLRVRAWSATEHFKVVSRKVKWLGESVKETNLLCLESLKMLVEALGMSELFGR